MATKRIWKKGEPLSWIEFIDNRGTHVREWKTIDGQIIIDELTVLDDQSNILTMKVKTIKGDGTHKVEIIEIPWTKLPEMIAQWNAFVTPTKSMYYV